MSRPDIGSYKPRGGFDISKVRWNVGDKPYQYGIYKPNPNIATRFYDAGTDDPHEIDEEFDRAEPEFQRLRGKGIRVPHLIYQLGPSPKDDCFGAYIFTSRLEGERADSLNSALTPQLLRLARALLSYYDDTKLNGYFLSDIGILRQYTFGTSYAQRGKEPPAMYLHDIEPSTRYRGEIDWDGTNSFDSSVRDVEHWLRYIPESQERDALLLHARHLQTEPEDW